MFVPLMTWWKAFGVLAANWYSIGFTLPRPEEDSDWFSNATIPAKSGAAAEVPPIIGRFVSVKALAMPPWQTLPVVPSFNSEFCVQKMYPGKFAEAINEISGVNLALACPEMVTVCHEG